MLIYDNNNNMNERIKKLRAETISIIPEICIERARIITDLYKQLDGYPVVLKRAKSLEKILDEMTIFIRPDELIVGNIASKVRAAPIFPEFSVNWIENELETFEKRSQEKFLINKKTKEELKEIISYWKGRTHFDRASNLIQSSLPEYIQKAYDSNNGIINQVIFKGRSLIDGDGHIIANYNKVLRFGIKGLKEEIYREIRKINVPENSAKKLFLEAVLITLDAVIRFAKRYSNEAKRLSEKEPSPQRRKELKHISLICERVPEFPARTFWEALQSFWFCHLIIQIESNGHGISFGRFDQYLFPFYNNDLKNNLITSEEALEFVESFWIKINELVKLRPWNSTRWYSGYPLYQTLTLGGRNVKKEDISNDLSYLCLKTTEILKLPQPTVVIAVHDKISENFLIRACETLLRHKGGLPSFFNDNIATRILLNLDIPEQDASDWAIVGCSEPTIPGKFATVSGCDCQFNLLKILELTLNGGRNYSNGVNLCNQKKNLLKFNNFDELFQLYKKQIKFYIRLMPILDKATNIAYQELTPTIFLSSLIDGSIEKGIDIQEGKWLDPYNYSNVLGQGIINVGNCLAALKKLVFEEKLIPVSKLKEVLSSNFFGIEGETIRQILINEAPKYGNDIDYVDLLSKEVWDYFISEIKNYKPYKGGKYAPSPQTISANIPQGEFIGATPDGRKANQPLADNISAAPGTDIHGPTAILKSASKFDHSSMIAGSIINIKFHPLSFKNINDIKKLASLILTYFKDLKGFQVQFNIISTDDLKKAQKNPKEFNNLVVKVAGYSAFFIALDKKVQDQIIERTEHIL